ncbi:hypothetical protein GCM10020331_020100 [Ectobacillus funiculus]
MPKTLQNAYIYKKNGIAIATAEEGQLHDQVLIAQAADTLLTMTGVVASFCNCQTNRTNDRHEWAFTWRN